MLPVLWPGAGPPSERGKTEFASTPIGTAESKLDTRGPGARCLVVGKRKLLPHPPQCHLGAAGPTNRTGPVARRASRYRHVEWASPCRGDPESLAGLTHPTLGDSQAVAADICQ